MLELGNISVSVNERCTEYRRSLGVFCMFQTGPSNLSLLEIAEEHKGPPVSVLVFHDQTSDVGLGFAELTQVVLGVL